MKHAIRSLSFSLQRLSVLRWGGRNVGTTATPPPPPPPRANPRGGQMPSNSSATFSETPVRKFSQQIFFRQSLPREGVDVTRGDLPNSLGLKLVRMNPRKSGVVTYCIDATVAKPRVAVAPPDATANANANKDSSVPQQPARVTLAPANPSSYIGYRLNMEGVATLILGLQYRELHLARTWLGDEHQQQQELRNETTLQILAVGDNTQIKMAKKMVGEEPVETDVIFTPAEVITIQGFLQEIIPTLAGWDLALSTISTVYN